MLKSVKEFLFNLNPDIVIQAPARINLINPLDAVEADYWMPSVAINGKSNPLSAFFYIKEIENESILKNYVVQKPDQINIFDLRYEEPLAKSEIGIRKKLKTQSKLVYASILRLLRFSSRFKKLFLKSNIEIGNITTIPPQSGLGGSSSIIISVLYGFAKYFNIFNNFDVLKDNEFPINKDTIAEMATKIEDEDLEISAGYSDRYVISKGGLCFCSYYGKLYHKNLSLEPLAIYDRIGETYEINEIPIIICFSGISHESGDVHGKLRRLYMTNNLKILNYYKTLAELSWKSRFAIMNHDWKLLGKFFKENTKIMNKVMILAGFRYGIGLVNNILIKIIETTPNVYAAKLTGAGDGGSVFAIVNPDKIDSVFFNLKKRFYEIIKDKVKFSSKFPSYPSETIGKLKNVSFFQIKIDQGGVKKL